jgi:hypothetical protein
MRVLLQFIGFASATLCALMVASAMLSTLAVADVVNPSPTGDCDSLCKCNSSEDGCIVRDNTFDCAGQCNCIVPTNPVSDVAVSSCSKA